jgi:dTDP-4-dehydrorhamnose reductase
MLKLARKTGARMLQASTSEVYGDPLEHPQKESYWGNVDPLGKRSCYDEGKRAGETLCKDYAIEYGADVRLIRIFNTYGPRMMFNDGRVLSNFIVQALLGEKITVHGDGTQTRSFCYVDDLVEGIIRRMEHEEKSWEPINLGNPDERSIGDLAQLVKDTTASKSEIILQPFSQIPNRLGDPKQRCPDITRAQTLLKWQPTINFAEGLARTIADFKQRMQHKPRLLIFVGKDSARTEAVQKIIDETVTVSPEWEFDIVTNDDSLQKRNGVMVYPVSNWFSAMRVGKELYKKNNYQVAWAVATGRAHIGAALFSWSIGGRVPLLLTAIESSVTDSMLHRGKALARWYTILMRYVYRWQVVAPLSTEQKRWLEDERHVSAVHYTGDPTNVALNAKQLFQELEILATRL